MLLNRDRADRVMDDAGFDGLLCLYNPNVRYVSGFWSKSMEARWDTYYGAVLPRRRDAPAAVVVTPMDLTALAHAGTWIENVLPYLVADPTGALDEDGTPKGLNIAPFMLPADDTKLTISEQRQAASLARYGDRTMPSLAAALARALKDAGLAKGRVAADDARAVLWLAQAGLDSLEVVYDPNVVKEIRMVKTPDEIALLRTAARINEAACREAASGVREGVAGDDVERAFMAACGRDGARGTYLVTSMGDHLPHGRLPRGEPMMLDALSTFGGYHGDFGRAVVVGEPSDLLVRRAGALRSGWEAAMALMRPGVTYDAIRDEIVGVVQQAGFAEFHGLSVHAVGLQHTDDPSPVGHPHMIKPSRPLEAGMVLNVDIPFEAYGWGSIHREDTVLVTGEGIETLTSCDDTLIVVDR